MKRLPLAACVAVSLGLAFVSPTLINSFEENVEQWQLAPVHLGNPIIALTIAFWMAAIMAYILGAAWLAKKVGKGLTYLASAVVGSILLFGVLELPFMATTSTPAFLWDQGMALAAIIVGLIAATVGIALGRATFATNAGGGDTSGEVGASNAKNETWFSQAFKRLGLHRSATATAASD